MRILYLHPRSWIGEYAMLVHLRRLGHEVCALEENRDLPETRRMADHFKQAGDGIATFWYNPRRGVERLLTWVFDRYYRRAFDGRNLVHRMWIVAAAARRFRPDVVIASDGFSYAVPAALLRRLGLLRAPLVVGCIGGDILDCPEAAYGRRRTLATDRLIKNVVRHADWLRPVSPLLVDVLQGDGADMSRVRMIPSHLVFDTQVVDAVFAARRELAAAIRRRYGIAADAPLVVTLSWNQKGKGAHVLAQAWPQILAAVPKARWLLCGPDDPWLTQAVWPVLEQAGIRDTVVATGRLAGRDIFEHLAAADLHANPTLCEGLNMVTVEAAAVGTPTICTDGCGIAAWIAQFGAGAVVPAAQAAPLADATIRALQDPALLSAYSAASRRMIADFTLDRVGQQLVSLFDAACGERPPTES
ncbi:MAG: glycosyltransferase family 4 protein [Rhodocyclaceae bacterium]|nr:glycosyltransferase family 4 protein [Rhodocyclaceae bacterium]